jgi:two-component system, NtrC family, sensor histidine kinase HydH
MEEQIGAHISDLENLNSELDGFLSDLHGRERSLSVRIGELEAQVFAAKDYAATEMLRFAQKESSINAAMEAAQASLKASEEESGRRLRTIEGLNADLLMARGALKETEGKLHKAERLREEMEKKLDQALRENSRSEDGYLLKLELVKKEMREQAKRADELDRKLAAAGARLEGALGDAARAEKALAGAAAEQAARETRLREAEQKAAELAKEVAEFRSGSLQETAARASETAAALAARVEELENSLSESASRHLDKFRSLQAELSSIKADLRVKTEENAALLAREHAAAKELGDAEEKWKFSTAQLHNAAARLRNAENELEITKGRLKSLAEERDKFRAAAIKAETAASGLAAQESQARDGEAAGLLAALEQQSSKYTELLRKYDDLVLLNETLAHEKAAVKTDADSLREALKAAQAAAEAEAGEKRGLQSGLAEKLRVLEAQLRKKDLELEETRSAAGLAAREAEELRQRLDGQAAGERERYAALSEKMHNTEALLKKKEFELDEARGALAGLEGECSLLRDSRAALGEKFAREIQAENELLRQAQAKIAERDSLISRLAGAEDELKREAELLKKEKQSLLAQMRKKAAGPVNSAKISEAERMLADKESRLVKLRAELDHTRAEKAELQGREKELREELKARPYRAMLREAEDKLLIKEKMLAEMNSHLQRVGKDFEELKARGQSAGAPGYLPDFEELVAGVAHQVANSISIIRSHAEFCSEAPDSERARESLDVIVRNIVSLQQKIDIIMSFSRPVIPQRSPERLGAVLEEVLEGLRASGRLGKIRFEIKGGEKLKPVSLDRVRFAAAVEQLLLNAAEAMPEGGVLGAVVTRGSGRQRLEITDTGPGVEKKHLGSVFHPFFTTKPGKMGLGLTLARNVARAHGGTLELHSEPGKGARAVMELPEIS